MMMYLQCHWRRSDPDEVQDWTDNVLVGGVNGAGGWRQPVITGDSAPC